MTWNDLWQLALLLLIAGGVVVLVLYGEADPLIDWFGK